MLRSVRRYLPLRAGDRWLFVSAFIWLGAVDVGLRLFGFQRTARCLQRADRRPARLPTPADVDRARRYARWLETASRYHIVRAACLHRSLVLHRWLRTDGVPSALRIGVRKERGSLRAHAWVEVAGHIVTDLPAAVATFTPLAGLGERRPVPHGGSEGLASGQAAVVELREVQWCQG